MRAWLPGAGERYMNLNAEAQNDPGTAIDGQSQGDEVGEGRV